MIVEEATKECSRRDSSRRDTIVEEKSESSASKAENTEDAIKIINHKHLFDKIWSNHLVDQQEDGTCLIYIDRHLSS